MIKKILSFVILILTVLMVVIPTCTPYVGYKLNEIYPRVNPNDINGNFVSKYSDEDIANGYWISEDRKWIQFILPEYIINQAFELSTDVKRFMHHGEYWNVWNWNSCREDATPDGGEYLPIEGEKVWATESIELIKFISNKTGYIQSSWGNDATYDFGVKICDISGVQLPDAITVDNVNIGGKIPNWIAKHPDDYSRWAIKDKPYGGSIDAPNAGIPNSRLFKEFTFSQVLKYDNFYLRSTSFSNMGTDNILNEQYRFKDYTVNEETLYFYLDLSIPKGDLFYKIGTFKWIKQFGGKTDNFEIKINEESKEGDIISNTNAPILKTSFSIDGKYRFKIVSWKENADWNNSNPIILIENLDLITTSTTYSLPRENKFK